MEHTPAPDEPRSGVVAQLASLASSEDHLAGSLVAQVEALVSSLVDQLAAGQVETLYSLHTAAGSVRRQTAELVAAAEAPMERMGQAVDVLQETQSSLALVAGRVTTDLAELLTSRMREQVDALVTERLTAAESSLAQATVDLVSTAAQQRDALTATAALAAEALTATANHAIDGLRTATGEVRDDIVAVTRQVLGAIGAGATGFAANAEEVRESVAASTAEAAALVGTETREALSRLGESAAGLTATANEVQAGLGATTREAIANINRVSEELVAVSAEHLESLEHASRILVEAFAGRMENFFHIFDEAVVVQSKRDGRLERDLDTRVAKLVDKTDAAVVRLANRIHNEADRMEAREAAQETARAEAFVTVLEGLLARAGGRRALRDRVRDALVADRKPEPVVRTPQAPPPAPVRAPLPAPAAKAAAPVKAAPVKAAPVKAPVKAVKAAAPAKKAPSKPAAKAAPKKAAPASKAQPTTRTKKETR